MGSKYPERQFLESVIWFTASTLILHIGPMVIRAVICKVNDRNKIGDARRMYKTEVNSGLRTRKGRLMLSFVTFYHVFR